jgi:hypothetical protein
MDRRGSSSGCQKLVDGDGGVELILFRAEDGNLLLAGGFKHVGGDGAERTDQDGSNADKGGDGNGVLMGLDGDQDGVFGGVGHDIAEQIRSERRGNLRVRGGGQEALRAGDVEQPFQLHGGEDTVQKRETPTPKRLPRRRGASDDARR